MVSSRNSKLRRRARNLGVDFAAGKGAKATAGQEGEPEEGNEATTTDTATPSQAPIHSAELLEESPGTTGDLLVRHSN